MSREDFFADRKTYWSSIKMIEIIGEAAGHILEDVRFLMPDIEWARIVGVRHVFVHGYFGINHDILWDIIESSVPKLKRQITTFVESHPQAE